eukprot:3926960-Prymnesium_polylepis.1
MHEARQRCWLVAMSNTSYTCGMRPFAWQLCSTRRLDGGIRAAIAPPSARDHHRATMASRSSVQWSH